MFVFLISSGKKQISPFLTPGKILEKSNAPREKILPTPMDPPLLSFREKTPVSRLYPEAMSLTLYTLQLLGVPGSSNFMSAVQQLVHNQQVRRFQI